MQVMLVEDMEVRAMSNLLSGVCEPQAATVRQRFLTNLLDTFYGRPKRNFEETGPTSAQGPVGARISAEELLRSLLGDDPSCPDTLHPSHLTQQVSFCLLRRYRGLLEFLMCIPGFVSSTCQVCIKR